MAFYAYSGEGSNDHRVCTIDWQQYWGVPQSQLVLPLLFFAVGGQAPIVMAQSEGSFSATGNMTAPRIGHTATLLPNGKVLSDGGISNYYLYPSGLPARAELYDPATGTFSATGDMIPTHSGGTHTVLPDGRVLITGGGYTTATTPAVLPDGRVVFPRIPNASAQLYDPSTGTFIATGDMTTVRLGHTATLLADGTVLMSGGSSGAFVILASAEGYALWQQPITPNTDLPYQFEYPLHRSTLPKNRARLPYNPFSQPIPYIPYPSQSLPLFFLQPLACSRPGRRRCFRTRAISCLAFKNSPKHADVS